MAENNYTKDGKNALTIYDIAKKSGFSVTTVSRVLNGSPNVSARTRNRISQVIEETGFSPSSVARALTSAQTKTIGIIISDITNPYFSSLYLEIQKYAVEAHYSTLVFNTFYGGSSHGVPASIPETQYFSMLLDKKVDGVLIMGGEIDKDVVTDEYIRSLNELGKAVPVVVLGEDPGNTSCTFISRNIESGVSTLVMHLAALGRRRIAFIGGEPGVKTTTCRLKAYEDTLRSLSLPVLPELISLSNYYMSDGYAAMTRLLENREAGPTGVLAINDAVAIGALRAMSDHGLKAPQDISVVSCDQFPSGEYYCPRITSLDRNEEYLGRFSIMTLLSLINGQKNVLTVAPSPRLIIRESCGGNDGLLFAQ